jgi:hypothetical protein
MVENRTILLVIILVIILTSIYQYVLTESQITQLKNMIQKEDENPTNVIVSTDNIIEKPINYQYGREYDYRSFEDPLVPPYKRDDFMLTYPSYPTRGYPTSFKKMGLLIDDNASNDDQYKFMILVGRQRFQNANYYDYYVTENKADAILKFDLGTNRREIMDGDMINIPELSKSYRSKIDRNLGFEYNPYVL